MSTYYSLTSGSSSSIDVMVLFFNVMNPRKMFERSYKKVIRWLKGQILICLPLLSNKNTYIINVSGKIKLYYNGSV